MGVIVFKVFPEILINFLLLSPNTMAECPNVEEHKLSCPCTYAGCSRKGVCCECLKHHLNNGELPACCFSSAAEATYDRSFRKFAEDKGFIGAE